MEDDENVSEIVRIPVVERVYFGVFGKHQRGEKVVQVLCDGVDYLKIGMHSLPMGYKIFHGTILQELLVDLNISFAVDEEDSCPLREGKRYLLRGAGDCWFVDGGYEFCGRSGKYGCGLDYGDLERVVKFFPKDVQVFKDRGEEAVLLGVGDGER